MTADPILFVAVMVILGIAVVLGYLGLAGGGHRRHQCQWETLAVTHLATVPFAPTQTAVLKLCTVCGDLTTGELLGQWTLDQLTARAAEAGTAEEGSQ